MESTRACGSFSLQLREILFLCKLTSTLALQLLFEQWVQMLLDWNAFFWWWHHDEYDEDWDDGDDDDDDDAMVTIRPFVSNCWPHTLVTILMSFFLCLSPLSAFCADLHSGWPELLYFVPVHHYLSNVRLAFVCPLMWTVPVWSFWAFDPFFSR